MSRGRRMHRPGRIAGQVAVAAALAGVGLGCAAQRVTAAWERGDAAATLRAAAAARRPLRGAAARAEAAALVASGRADAGASAYLRAFTRGGDGLALRELIGLHLAQGHAGLAAAHARRLVALEPALARGDVGVCAALRTRAQAYAALGEGLAALDDLDAARAACGEDDSDGALARLRARVEPLAQAQALARRGPLEVDRAASAGPDAGGAAPPDPGADAERTPLGGEASARAPEEMARWIRAELDDQLGTALVGDAQLRRWVGDRDRIELLAWLDGKTGAEADGMRLHLTRIGVGPDGVSDGERGLWSLRLADRLAADAAADRAGAGAPTMDGSQPRGPAVPLRAAGWRAFALAGDLDAAELTIVTALRERERAARAPEPGTDAEAAATASAKPSRAAASRPASAPAAPAAPTGPLAARVPVDDPTLVALLAWSRLKLARGQVDAALELAAIAAARGATLPRASRLVRERAATELIAGRPWSALALLAAVDPREVEALRRAAWATLTWIEGSPDERRDRERVARVLGDDALAQLVRAAAESTAPRTAEVRPGCPALIEVVAAEPPGPLGRALRAIAGDEPRVVQGALARAAVAADPTLACAAELLAPIWPEATEPDAAALLEQLRHAPELRAESSARALFDLALAAADRGAADTFAPLAPAAARDPEGAWRHVARAAQVAGLGALERRALRELLVLRGEDEPVMVALLLAGWRDADGTWAAQDSVAAREVPEHALEELLQRVPTTRRWAVVEAIAAGAADVAWTDPQLRERLAAVLWRAADPQRHPLGFARFPAADAAPVTVSAADPSRVADAARLALALDDDRLAAAWRAQPLGREPVAGLELAAALLDPDGLTATRAALVAGVAARRREGADPWSDVGSGATGEPVPVLAIVAAAAALGPESLRRDAVRELAIRARLEARAAATSDAAAGPRWLLRAAQASAAIDRVDGPSVPVITDAGRWVAALYGRP